MVSSGDRALIVYVPLILVLAILEVSTTVELPYIGLISRSVLFIGMAVEG